MSRTASAARNIGQANRHTPRPGPAREPVVTQLSGFVELFVWLLVLKQFFLPLFIIPTGSMAETLAGEHCVQTCTNCGWEYKVGKFGTRFPSPVICPNCRWAGDPLATHNIKAGDRVVVHGWVHDVLPRALQRWDVVVFKDPKDGVTNFIKRLIGLPGESIELIDGDVWVNGAVARKTAEAQAALWMPYYDHDFPPTKPGGFSVGNRPVAYFPRWKALPEASAWKDLETRVLRFDGLERGEDLVAFSTDPREEASGGEVVDIYGYNSLENAQVADGARRWFDPVTDVRVAADVIFREASDGGYVELQIAKYTRLFFARLYADGRVTLETEEVGKGQRSRWGHESRVRLARGTPVRFSVGHADYQVVVAIDGREIIVSSKDEYALTPEQARAHSDLKPRWQQIRIGAARVRAELAHVRIDRDVHYRSGYLNRRLVGPGEQPPADSFATDGFVRDKRWFVTPGTGTQRHAITLDADEYFVLGDNSPSSADSRAWSPNEIGPHLVAAWQRGDYHIGTVPSDQMIGPAFLVYFPGLMPLTSWNLPLSPWGDRALPDVGRIRWIH